MTFVVVFNMQENDLWVPNWVARNRDIMLLGPVASLLPSLSTQFCAPAGILGGDGEQRWGWRQRRTGAGASARCRHALPAFSPQPSLPGAIEVGLECLVVWEKPERTFCTRWRWLFIFGKCSIHRGLPVFGNPLTQHPVLNL